VADGFDDVAVVQMGLDDHPMSAFVQRLDRGRGASGLQRLMTSALAPTVVREGVECSEAEMLQSFAGRQDPVVVPARKQVSRVEYCGGRCVDDVLGPVAGMDENVGAVVEAVDVDSDLRRQRERGIVDLQHGWYAGVPVTESPEDCAQARGGDLVGAVGPEGRGRMRSGASVLQCQQGDEVLRTGRQFDRSHLASPAVHRREEPVAQELQLHVGFNDCLHGPPPLVEVAVRHRPAPPGR